MIKNFLFITICAFFFGYCQCNLEEKTTDKTILVVGGAGYIGSYVNEMLYKAGYQTIVLDNLSTGCVESILHGIFIEGDIADRDLLDWIFKNYSIDAVMHFAALKNVGESVKDPLKYYKNNVVYTLNLIEIMIKHHVNVFIFSSSASVFGLPSEGYVTENCETNPINPYGQTKLIVEKVLQDLGRAYGLRYSILRYFNAAGGDPEGKIKNHLKYEKNLIPIVLNSLLDPNGEVEIFGTDYDTPDGTCLRDYIHIHDLGSAHILAMEQLFQGNMLSSCYNLGNEKAISVQEVIAAVERVTGRKVNIKVAPRRVGDPAQLIASAEKAKLELGWIPKYVYFDEMVEHAWIALGEEVMRNNY